MALRQAARRIAGVTGASRGRSMSTYTLPPLKYKYDALEPHIDAKTMQLHHTRHHQTYVSSLNAILRGEHGQSLKGLSLPETVAACHSLPDAIRTPTINHAGGHLNHAIFFAHLGASSSSSSGEASGDLRVAIDETFGGFDAFKDEFTRSALGVFGSGWAWLQVGVDGRLQITKTANQENPLMKGVVASPGIPILGVDVWEHAYYLKNQNRRAEYVDSFWNVIDWQVVGANFAKASEGDADLVAVPLE